MNQWTNKSMNECMNQWTVEQMNQGANESMNFANLILQNSSDSFNLFGGFEVQIELLLQSRAHFVSFICQKCSDPFSFFLRLWSAKQFLWNTVSCAFCQLHLPKLLRYAPIPSVFLRFRHANRALVTVLSTFCRPYLPKVFRAWQIFNIWSANRAFPTVWCAFFRPPLLKVFWSLQFFFTFEVQIRLLLSSKSAPASSVFRHFEMQIELPQSCAQSCALFVDNFRSSRPGTAETPYFGDPRSPKKHTVSCGECLHPWIHTLPNCYASQLTWQLTWSWVVDMTMWLTWWWEC